MILIALLVLSLVGLVYAYRKTKTIEGMTTINKGSLLCRVDIDQHVMKVLMFASLTLGACAGVTVVIVCVCVCVCVYLSVPALAVTCLVYKYQLRCCRVPYGVTNVCIVWIR